MIKGLLLTSLFALTAFNANAAVVPYGQYREISGSGIWEFTATVTEYYTNSPQFNDVPQLGDTAQKHVEADFTGYVDNTGTVVSYPDFRYDFSNGWYASSNGPHSVDQATTCGYSFNFCVGALAEPEFEVYRSEISYNINFLAEIFSGIPNSNAVNVIPMPISVSFTENVIIQKRNDNNDFHYFTVFGTQTFSKGFTVVPLPASGALLAFALLPLIARRRNAKLI